MATFLFILTHEKNPSEFLVEQRAKSNEQQAKSNEQHTRSNEQQAKSNEQQAESNEQQTKSNDIEQKVTRNKQMVASKEQKVKSNEQRAKTNKQPTKSKTFHLQLFKATCIRIWFVAISVLAKILQLHRVIRKRKRQGNVQECVT